VVRPVTCVTRGQYQTYSNLDAERHRSLASTKLYCLVTEKQCYCCKQLHAVATHSPAPGDKPGLATLWS